MILADVVFLGGDTSRTRCYLQALGAASLFPRHCILLPGSLRPGQRADRSMKKLAAPWGAYEPDVPVEELCSRFSIPIIHALNGDVNSADMVEFLRCQPGKVFIYSGFGGVILKRNTLNAGKKFLHVHGGWLPEYKGSTTNYYSLLAEGYCGASAIFLTADIDGGEIIARQKFPPPDDARELDHLWDGIYRSEVLVKVMRHYAETASWPAPVAENNPTRMFYIMHPVLRHVCCFKNQ